jgi:hypothetical protein
LIGADRRVMLVSMNLLRNALRTGAWLGISFLLPHAGIGALKWETQRIDLAANFSDKTVVGVFRFTNTGQSPITILDLRPNCGCTVAELTKRSYAPGESGEIKTTFTFEGRLGLQEKTVQVVADDEPAKSIPLILQVNILEPMTCAPRLLVWRVGGEKGEKSATISATDTNRISAVKIQPRTLEEITARVETVAEGKTYRVVVQPNSLEKTRDVTIPCVVSFADGSALNFSVFALVR